MRLTSYIVIAFALLAVPPSPLSPLVSSARAADSVGELKQWLAAAPTSRPALAEQPFATAPLSKVDAEAAAQLLMADRLATLRIERKQEWTDGVIPLGTDTLKLLRKTFGKKPKDGWNLFISMHGGGGAPAEVNDQQWQNQIKLYQPPDSLYIAPRAPGNTWNMWHTASVDGLFSRLIEDAVALGDVDPNHVYLMGYSAGGDGVYQLAPRMADRFAAASMMAGHPNSSSPLSLRNIPFAIHVGALDDGYNRNKVAVEYGEKMDELQHEDPGGYVHITQLHAGRAHWMNLEDAAAVPWMLQYPRNPIPDRIVWNQASPIHAQFYWLQLPKDQTPGGQLIIAARKGQEITLEKADKVTHLTLLLNDAMLDLDKPVRITFGGKELLAAPVPRTIGALAAGITARSDPDAIFCASVTVDIPQ